LFTGYIKGDMVEKADDYEEWLQVLDDLSYREFQILVVLHRYEVMAGIVEDENKNQGHVIQGYWSDFVRTVSAEVGVPENAVKGIMERLTRTGLYWAGVPTGGAVAVPELSIGYLTPNFNKFLEALDQNTVP